MAGWFPIDPNKLKQLAASTLINAQKQIGSIDFICCLFRKNFLFIYLDKVLDIKDGAPGTEHQPIGKFHLIQIKNNQLIFFVLWNYLASNIPIGDEFFSTFLGNQRPPSPPPPPPQIEKEEIKIEKEEIKIENETPLSNWNSWGDNNNASQLVR